MQELEDFSPMQWLKERLIPRSPDESRISRVSTILPCGFEAYGKVLHPIVEHPVDFEFPIDLTKDTTYNDLWQLQKAPRFKGLDELALERRDAQGLGKRVRWRQLFEERGLAWVPEINGHSFAHQTGGSWPFYLQGPDEGFIGPELMARLVGLLAPFTGENECYFFFVMMATEDYQDKLFRGRLHDLLASFPGIQPYQTPTYCWPDDQSWCLCSDYDLEFTLIGGSRALISKLLTNSFVEAIEVLESTRVDYRADQTNVR